MLRKLYAMLVQFGVRIRTRDLAIIVIRRRIEIAWRTSLKMLRRSSATCTTNPLTDVFALVESFRDLSGKNSVHGAHDDQHDGIGKGDHVTGVNVTVANEQIIFPGRVVVFGCVRVDYHPDTVH